MINAPRARATLAFIFFVLLLDTLGVGLIIPVAPRIVGSLVNGDLGAASRAYGWFVAVYSVMQVLFAPVLGALSDRFGRRPVILVSLLGAAVDYLALAFAPSLGWLFVGRAIAGVTGANFSAATAYVADITPPDRRAQGFGLLGAAFGIGLVLGPSLGGLIGDVNPRAPFLVASGLNALNLLFGLFVLPESLAPEDRRAFSFARANPLGALRTLTNRPARYGITAVLACTYLAQQILQSVWVLHAQARFAWGPREVGLSLAGAGLATGIVQGGVVRYVIPVLRERHTALLGMVCNVTAFIGFGTITHGWMMYAVIVPFALGGLAAPAMQSTLSSDASASEQGEIHGSLASLQSMMAIAGPIVGTGLFAYFAPASARVRLPGAPYLAGAALHAMGLVLALKAVRPGKRTRD